MKAFRRTTCRRSGGRAVVALLFVAAGVVASPAVTLGRPSVQPIFVRMPLTSGDEEAQARFEAECRRQKWNATATVDFAAPSQPHAAQALAAAEGFIGELKWSEALRELDAAAADAVLTGAGGLTTAQLADIHLFRATVRQKMESVDSPRAWEDYVRAATFNPERVLDPGRVPPAAIAMWNRATTALQRRPHGTLIVRGPPDAAISIDGRSPVRSPALVAGLSYGEHLVRVEEPGRWPWASTVPLTSPTMEMDVPFRAELSIDDGSAAEMAQRKGAAFALVAQQRPGRAGDLLLELRLVDAAQRVRRAVSLVSLPQKEDLAAAIDRLAAQIHATEPAPIVKTITEPAPEASGKKRMLIGLAVVAALAVSFTVGYYAAVATDYDDELRPVFSTTLTLPPR